MLRLVAGTNVVVFTKAPLRSAQFLLHKLYKQMKNTCKRALLYKGKKKLVVKNSTPNTRFTEKI